MLVAMFNDPDRIRKFMQEQLQMLLAADSTPEQRLRAGRALVDRGERALPYLVTAWLRRENRLRASSILELIRAIDPNFLGESP
jgi:hypothetical protein